MRGKGGHGCRARHLQQLGALEQGAARLDQVVHDDDVAAPGGALLEADDALVAVADLERESNERESGGEPRKERRGLSLSIPARSLARSVFSPPPPLFFLLFFF